MSADAFADAFVLAQGLRGRAPEGRPPPRALDVLVFHRARARFIATHAEPVAAGPLPWPGAGVEEPLDDAETGSPPEDRAAAPAPAGPSSSPAAPAPAAERRHAAAPAAPAGAPAGAGPPGTLRHRQPAVPSAAPSPAPARADAPPSRPGRAASGEGERAAGSAAGAGRPQPADPAPGRAGERALDLLAASGPSPDGVPVPPADPAAPRPPALPWAPAASTGAPTPAERPSAPRSVPAAPEQARERPPAPRARPDSLPFVPSPARSAAAVAERVARAATGRGPSARRAQARHDELVAVAQPVRHAEREREALTPRSLLREVTRDEVVRALAERMRALARDDRFRLGELR